MAPEEAQANPQRRRGRPPGSKNKSTRRTRAAGTDLVAQLNAMVAELIKKNRQLQRQVAKLTERAGVSRASTSVERGIRTLSRRVEKALGARPVKRRRASTNGRRRKAPTTRRKRASS